MWVLSDRLGSYYRFEPTHSGLVAEEMIEGQQGSVVTDGFSGYNRIKRLSGVRVGHCWAHASREFADRDDDYPIEVAQIGAMIEQLYAIEGRAKTFDQLRALRSTESKELIDKMRN